MQMVSMRDYEGFGGFGVQGRGGFNAMANTDVEELVKAIGAGYQSPRTEGSNVLRVESLEATLRVLTYGNQHVKLWKVIPKIPAYSTTEEFNLQTSYGADAGMFIADGELPQSQDATYERKSVLVKYIGTTREVTHVATLTKPAHGNQIAMETANGTTWLIGRLESALFNARADVNPHAFDGLDKQIQDDPVASVRNVIDLRGGIITEARMEEAANLVTEGFGVPTDLFAAPRALSDLGKSFYPKERVALPGPVNGRVGLAISEVTTTAGIIPLQSDLFLRSGGPDGRKYAPSSATSTKAPSAPTIAGTPSSSSSQFTSADVGTYQYKATAFNRYGESAPGQESGGVAISAADDIATLAITDGGGEAATGYRIYRSAKDGAAGTEQLIAEVPRVGGGATYIDANQYLPGCSRAYMLQVNTQSLAVKQLAPMMKIPLATIALSIRWSQVIYLVPVVYKPLTNVIFINVADGPVT